VADPTALDDWFRSVSLTTTRSDRVRWVDIFALLAVPLTLCAVFTLPEPVRQSLAFDYSDPTILAAFVAPYVHLGWMHLLVNVLGYLVIIPMAYVLSVASGRRTRFFTVFGTFLVVLPPALSYLNLAVPRSGSALGFSGVVLAFVGYLAYAIADYLCAALRLGPVVSLSPVIFFLGFALAAPLSVRSVTVDRATVALGTGGLVLATLLAAVLFALSAVDGSETFRRRFEAATKRRGPFGLAVFALGVFVTFLFLAFPAEPDRGMATVNLYTHLLGYALGFTSTYLSVQLFEYVDAAAVES